MYIGWLIDRLMINRAVVVKEMPETTVTVYYHYVEYRLIYKSSIIAVDRLLTLHSNFL